MLLVVGKTFVKLPTAKLENYSSDVSLSVSWAAPRGLSPSAACTNLVLCLDHILRVNIDTPSHAWRQLNLVEIGNQIIEVILKPTSALALELQLYAKTAGAFFHR